MVHNNMTTSRVMSPTLYLLALLALTALWAVQAQTYDGSTEYLATLEDALEGDKNESGPILYKTFESAYNCLLAQDPPSLQSQPQPFYVKSFGNGSLSSLAATYDNSSLALTLAFHTSSQENSSLTSSLTDLAPWDDLSEVFGGNPPGVNPTALRLFNEATFDFTGTVRSFLPEGDSTINRILCTGRHGGGALAQLCGPWASLQYPASQVRVITFGAPRVGDRKFSYALQQLVDLAYLWMTASDNRTIGTLPSGSGLRTPDLTRIIPETNFSGSGEISSIQYYSTLLNNTFKGQQGYIPVLLQTNYSYGYLPRGKDSQYVMTLASDDGSILEGVEGVADTIADTANAAGSAISNIFGNVFGGASSPQESEVADLADASGPTQESAGGNGSAISASEQCTPVLCKIRPALVQACASYNDGASLGEGSVTVHADIGTDVALQWLADTKTAIFVFRGTESTEDWRSNLKFRFSGDVSQGYFSELYTGSEIYEGELESFRAVTDQPTSDESNIRARMYRLSGDEEPVQIHCIGHSLGGGLATICGPWAAETWPAADIRVVTFGSPKSGNLAAEASVLASVGRVYRVVHSNDAVPSLPPFDSYVHANYALYLTQSELTLDDRPPMGIGDLTWDAHGCDDQYGAALQDVMNVTIPSWVQQMSAS